MMIVWYAAGEGGGKGEEMVAHFFIILLGFHGSSGLVQTIVQ